MWESELKCVLTSESTVILSFPSCEINLMANLEQFVKLHKKKVFISFQFLSLDFSELDFD